MGCLNSHGQFSHWFGNIHLSGPCNRSCYFCIGQHMMALDPYNNLKTWPLTNIDKFIIKCNEHRVREINLTGSNTDPLLYEHTEDLANYLKLCIPDAKLGVRTNGADAQFKMGTLGLFDNISISITSFDKGIYERTMGRGTPPNPKLLRELTRHKKLKVNVVLCPEILNGDLIETLDVLSNAGVETVNLREPYGQPNIGDPFKLLGPSGFRHGMPCHRILNMDVTYWDVHYVEVESVNLYANGVVSETYPITKGHDPVDGKIEDQSNFTKSGRVREQWVKVGGRI